MSFSVIILAAGKGSRMNSKTPKVFHKVGNLPMISHVLNLSASLKPKIVTMVVSQELESYKEIIKKTYRSIKFATQAEQLGTADAVKCALGEKSFKNSDISMILYGDTPLISNFTLKKSLEKFKKMNLDLCILSMTPPNTDHSYGRLIVKNDRIEKIIEKSEIKNSQQVENLCNTGIMIIKTKYLGEKLKKIKNENKKREFFLTDIVEIFNHEGYKVSHLEFPYYEFLGVNNKRELALVENQFQKIAREKFLKKGVTLIDPNSVFFSSDTKIGQDVVIHPNVHFGVNVEIGNEVEIKSFCHLENTVIKDKASIGPFARLRDETKIEREVKIGNFVEIKKSNLESNVKVSHLSYIGDADIGKDSNIGAGMITCNYDGLKKNKTFIGQNCFIGSNTSLIAPIKISKDSIIGASTVIDKNIPEGTTVYRKSELIKKNNKR